MESSGGHAHNYSTNLRERVYSMLQTGRWVDCKFLVGTELQELIEGHKNILASASPVFDTMFFGGIGDSQNPVLIPDIQPATFKTLQKYIYTDDVKISSLDEAFNLYYAGNKYILPNLENICIAYIKSNLVSANVCRAYEFALLFKDCELMTKCLELMRTQTSSILKVTRFEDIQLSTLDAMFSLERVNCTALEMFNALQKYVKVQKRHVNSGIDPYDYIEPLNLWSECSSGSSDCVDRDEGAAPAPLPSSCNVTPEIRAVLEKIPFLTLTAQEFAEGPAKSDLLTESEKLAIFMNIASDKTNMPMPSGFSTQRWNKKLTHISTDEWWKPRCSSSSMLSEIVRK